jgi:hypothetical protein
MSEFGVGQGLNEDGLGVGLNGCLDLLQIPGIDERGGDAESRKGVL